MFRLLCFSSSPFFSLFVLIIALAIAKKNEDLPRLNDLNAYNGEELFYKTAAAQEVVSDKIGVTHDYDIMYGMFLMPLRQKLIDQGKKMKLLEIGLGCNMSYGPGASAKLWDVLFPDGELWMADNDEECVREHKKNKKLDRFNVLVGDQSRPRAVEKWVQKSGGNFSVIIDDGGRHNKQILNSLITLWPALLPGGVYFLEDLLVGADAKYNYDLSYEVEDHTKYPPTMAVIQAWIHYLVIDQNYQLSPDGHVFHRKILKRFPPLENMEVIFCQISACAIRKKKSKKDNYRDHY